MFEFYRDVGEIKPLVHRLVFDIDNSRAVYVDCIKLFSASCRLLPVDVKIGAGIAVRKRLGVVCGVGATFMTRCFLRPL